MRRRRRRDAERAIDAVAAGEAIPEGTLDDPDDVAALRAAIELRASRLGADLPTSETVDDITRRVAGDDVQRAPSRFSRRTLLVAGGAVAAAGAAGVVVDRTLIGPTESTPSRNVAEELRPIEGDWVPVATADQLAAGTPHRFATPGVVGFVSQQNGTPLAVSGACTHQGCLLQANSDAGRLDCPCHRTAFAPDGKVVFSQLPNAPPPLPKIRSRLRDGNVEVFLPREV